jgi:hypothetical protein
MNIEERNYWSDHRTIAGMTDKWYTAIDEGKMLARIEFENDDGVILDEWVPFTYGVCPTCRGKGKHVNPGIDAGGISAEDFANDYSFYEDYMAGTYDVTCNQCHGKRVVPECNDERVLLRMEADLAYARLCAAERAMGA